MPNLLAMSFEGELAPSFDLRCLAEGRRLPDGWGLGYYPGGEPSAVVLKEPAPPQGSIRGQLARAWEHLESSLFALHIRTATWGAISDANTQPFVRSWGRRDWMMAHAGSLASKLVTDDKGVFEPVGSTDTEQIFCHLMNKLAEKGWRSLLEADLQEVRTWLDLLNDHGQLTIALTDGRDLLAYADRKGVPLNLGTIAPPYERVAFGNDDLLVDLSVRGTKARKGVVVCTDPLGAPDDKAAAPAWTTIAPGHLVLVRQGAVVADLGPPAPGPQASLGHLVSASVAARALSRPAPATITKWRVKHRTSYKYAKPVERSSHVIRLTPVADRLQEVLEHDVKVSVAGQVKDYDDVFGNRARRLVIDTPFSELVIEATSLVEVRDIDPLDFRPLKARSTIPLVWMPWQRQILAPFLLPQELPETQLEELTEYAMSFVKRNDFDLLDTLIDINATIFKEYEYRQGSTTVFTTPFEVYTNRRGVCQDFTNLFICLARLLGVPARYVCGYIYTGPKNPNQVQSEASHAWVQLYLPEAGWKGFDPTNGILTQTNHIRVAVGRNYIDATPTSGTIYVGGGPETLEVSVTVEPA
ncbi:MAG TPA: class II glutamine amidotransferase [Kofleriaceae bacterium]|nr:class II glutamine amidotransferase [Kofleriaceae bacterium]